MIGAGLHLSSPDGHSVDFSVTRGGASDGRRQPLSGRREKQLTHVPTALIYNFAWSGDGKTLVASCATRTADIVLLAEGAKRSP
jgi:hypothetical protein